MREHKYRVWDKKEKRMLNYDSDLLITLNGKLLFWYEEGGRMNMGYRLTRT